MRIAYTKDGRVAKEWGYPLDDAWNEVAYRLQSGASVLLARPRQASGINGPSIALSPDYDYYAYLQ